MSENVRNLSQRQQIERDTERALNRQMIPIMLPLVIGAGMLLAMLIALLFMAFVPQSVLLLLATVALVVAFSPITSVAIRYR